MPDTDLLEPAAQAEQQSETVQTESGAPDTPETVETDEQKTERAKEEEARVNRKKEEKRQTSFQKRIDELTTDKYEERKRADELMKQNQRLLELYGHKTGAATPSTGEPTRELFENYEDFVTARAEYRAEAKVTAALEKFTTTQQATQAKTAKETDQAAVEKQFLERRLVDANVVKLWRCDGQGLVKLVGVTFFKVLYFYCFACCTSLHTCLN